MGRILVKDKTGQYHNTPDWYYYEPAKAGPAGLSNYIKVGLGLDLSPTFRIRWTEIGTKH